MVSRRRYGTRKRYYRRYKKRNYLPRMVRRIVNKNREFKFTDTAGQNASGVATFTLLNGVGQSLLDTGRVGNQVTNRAIQLMLSASNAAANTSTYRLIIFWDRQANQTAPAITDLYDTATISFIEGALREKDYRRRFWILMDRCGVLSSTDSDDYGVKKYIKYYKRLTMKSIYDGAGATIAAIRTGSLYMYWHFSQGADVTVDYHARVTFTDS